MPKLSKQAGIELIIAELKKGTVTLDILAVIGSKWQLAEKTFYNWLKVAKEQYNKTQEAINKAKEVQDIENKINELKTASLTKLDRILIAENIAMAKAKKVNGQIMIPSASDQLKALDYISKIEGDYAPTKTANTDVEGKDKDTFTIIGAPTDKILKGL